MEIATKNRGNGKVVYKKHTGRCGIDWLFQTWGGKGNLSPREKPGNSVYG